MSLETLHRQLASIIRGKDEALRLVIATLVTGGHLLLDDLPGTGKTSLARSLGALLRVGDRPARFSRIQFTPDLLPYDVTGVDIYDPSRRRFSFVPGPVFAHVLLADEINRATPKVQSALLEVMNEGQVTVGGTSYRLDELFMVIATENPVTMEGTYPLPLAQLDRFMVRLSLGFPDEETELSILQDDPVHRALPALQPVVDRAELLAARAEVASLHCRSELARAVVRLAAATRSDARLRYGASPRASGHLLAMMRARAYLQGRDFVADEDLLALAVPVLAHRTPAASPDIEVEQVIAEHAAAVTAALREHDRVS